MRINKYIAGAGYSSRRNADKLIQDGKVQVNGVKMTEPGYDVVRGDVITVEGHKIESIEKKVYYAINKSIGVITSVTDDRGRFTVTNILSDVDERVFPVGRLDYNTSGLLFVTNDGDFAYKLTHPKHNVDKKYLVRIAGNISREKLGELRRGVDIGGFITSRARADVVESNKHSSVIEITIHEGKNRQVRRMFEAVGYNVEELERVSVGNIKLGHLKPGQYRKLTDTEIEYLLGL